MTRMTRIIGWLVGVGGNSSRGEGLCGICHKLAVCGTKEGLSYEGLPTEALVAIVTVALLYHLILRAGSPML